MIRSALSAFIERSIELKKGAAEIKFLIINIEDEQMKRKNNKNRSETEESR